MKINCEYTELVPIHKLVPHVRNANRHSEKQIEVVAKLLDFQGWRHPIVVSKLSGYITSGHCRLESAKKLGWTEVPVSYQEFENEAQETAFLFSDNKSASLAEHDDAFMIDVLKDLELEDMDFDLLGMPDFELPNFEPASENEQGKLDEVKIKIMECPHCGQTFEEKQAKIID